MYIKELEIDKFKSFAQKVNIPFMKGFTTIAGPNGSGKSNIIDAILFSLGLATANEMREKKLSEFISLYTNSKEASVTVTFDTENPDEPELKIKRRIKKGSQGYNSTYYLNDRPVTLGEVHLVLDKYNVNPNSYNVVMQNEVYKVTDCTPRERRKYIDEIAGVAEFDRKIEQANEQLDVVEQRVERSALILEEVSKNLENLAEEREQALKYKKLKDEKTIYESQVTTVKYFETKKSIELVHQNILDFNKKKKEEEVKLKDIEKEIEKKQKEFDDAEELVKSKGEAKQLEVKSKVEETKGEIERKKSSSNFMEKQIQQNLKTIENSQNGIETAKNKITENEKTIELKKIDIKTIEEEIKNQKAELDRIALETAGLNETANKFIQKRNELRIKLDEAKDKDVNIQKEKAPLDAEYLSLKKELTQIDETLENFESFKKEYAQKKDTLNAQIEELAKEMADFKSIQEKTMDELDKTKNELQSLNYDIRTAQQTVARMEGQRLAFEEANLGDGIDTIMRAKLKGVHAPLVQLGVVDKEYSTAMEIAMGARMKNVVVDDDYVAQQAIEILKSAGKGRLTFLPLNKLKKAPSGLRIPKDKGVIDFAINLIDFDDEYFDAFFYALGDTLIVEDYSTAQKLIGKYRLVTLSGELFEKSGAITGGAIRKSGLKFATTEADEIDKYKQRLKELEKKFLALDDKRLKLEDKCESIKKNYSDVMTEHSKAKIQKDSLEANYKESTTTIEEKQARKQEVISLIDKTDKKLNKLEEDEAKISQLTLELQEEIKKIESQISEDELEKLRKSTEGLEEEIKKLEKKKADINTEINDLKRENEFNRNTSIKANEQKIEGLKKDNENLKTDIKLRAEEIKNLENTIIELNKQIEELADVLSELQKQRDEISRALVNLSTQKGTYENNLERTVEQLEALKTRRKELDPILDEIRNQLIEAGIEISKLEPTEISVDELTAKINRLEKRMQELEPVNMRAIDAYDECLKRKEDIDEKINTLSSERKEILSKMTGFEEAKKKSFLDVYNKINENYKEIYATLSEGTGTLVMDNEESPFESGLDLLVKPRDKKITSLKSLSGGEKALAALSFVFAIQKNSPAPFYALDEVDKDLDPLNVDKLSKMVSSQAKETQFIVISHKPSMLEVSNRTIGVTQKEKGITKVTGIINKEMVNVN